MSSRERGGGEGGGEENSRQMRVFMESVCFYCSHPLPPPPKQSPTNPQRGGGGEGRGGRTAINYLCLGNLCIGTVQPPPPTLPPQI